MAKKRTVRPNETEGFYIKVSAASAFVSRMEPDRRHSYGTSAYITVEGTLDHPVSGRTKALISIHEDGGDHTTGTAIGVSADCWQVVTFLPEPQFSHTLTFVANDKLDYCYIAVRGLKRGSGPVVSAGFHTPPVPSRAGESPF
jgi:hypothetical protein